MFYSYWCLRTKCKRYYWPWNESFYSSRILTVPSDHMLVVIWPVSEVMIACHAGIRPFTCMRSSVRLWIQQSIFRQFLNKDIGGCLTARTPLNRNRLLQYSHSYGISPVWMRMCSFNVFFSRKSRLHTWHLCGRWSVWTFLWVVRRFAVLNLKKCGQKRKRRIVEHLCSLLLLHLGI